MRIVVAGGHGQIARLLHPLLAVRGHTPVGLIRNPEHATDLKDLGAEPVVLDLESAEDGDLDAALSGTDAVVFAAGAGAGSGAARKLTVDRDGAIRLADAAVRTGVRRYVMVSAMGTRRVDRGSDDVFQIYLAAKADADAYLRGTDLDWTIVRPGLLTDAEPTGRVAVGQLDRGSIPRADVAAVLAAVVTGADLAHREFDLLSGNTPIREALEAVASGSPVTTPGRA
jgi:uncharacterized protein YbjT (DUF2867 family)